MFTGLILDVGRVEALKRSGSFATLRVATKLADDSLKLGDSLAVNGACLTAVSRHVDSVELEIVAETLNRTNLGELRTGGRVNLERPLRLGDRLDGHWVLGHVDTVAHVESVKEVGPSRVVSLVLDGKWLRYIVEKGSVALDGVSLTVAAVSDTGFSVSLVPHTLSSCTMGSKKVGDRINLETDILAKHVERFVSFGGSLEEKAGIKKETLEKYGFL